MGPVIRAVDIADLATFRTLNDAAVPAVNRIPLSTFDWFRVHAPYFRAAVEDDTTLAFLSALTPGLDYDSPNYRWFEHRSVGRVTHRLRGCLVAGHEDLLPSVRGAALEQLEQ